MDIITLSTGDMKTGTIQSYADGVFLLRTSSGEVRLGTNEVERITFSSGVEGSVTLTNGHSGKLRLFSYGNGDFTFQKGAVDRGTVPCQRVKLIAFRQIEVGQSDSSGISRPYSDAGNHAGWPSPSHSSSSGTSSSYGGTGFGHVGERTSYSSSGTSGGPVWVDGYYRADGTWVEGHWRDAPGTATHTSYSGSTAGRVWVPGYRRADGTWVDGYWRDAGRPGTGTTTHSSPSSYSGSSYRRGGSVYVRGYYRKDGTYVSGHTRRK